MENRILKALAAFIAARKLTQWDSDEHNRFIITILSALPPGEWKAALAVLGLGGNCSAFTKAMTARNTDEKSAFKGLLLTQKSKADAMDATVEEIMVLVV